MQKLNEPKGFLAGLSGMLLILTIVFVMFVEALVLLPSISNFRKTWLDDKMSTAEAAVVMLSGQENLSLSKDAQMDLLSVTDSHAIILEQNGTRRFILTMELPNETQYQINLDELSGFGAVMMAFDNFFIEDDSLIRVVGTMDVLPGQLELIIEGKKLRDAMWVFARNVLLISLLIAFFTALLVYMAMRWLIIRPMQKITANMVEFSENPENGASVMPSSRRDDEIGIAQNHLRAMQSELQTVLGEKKRLANLGLAVSKINHDMRNILTSALLFSDRLNAVDDPKVQSFAPKLVAVIERATDYTQNVLEYGKAKEAPVEKKQKILLYDLGEDVAELLGLDRADDVEWQNNVPKDLTILCDKEQMFRVLMNLARNSLQALREKSADLDEQKLILGAELSGEAVLIVISDTGPGVPEQAREKLFEAFQGSTRSGGTGLGIAIAGEIVNAHGGEIKLRDNGADQKGAAFEIKLPI